VDQCCKRGCKRGLFDRLIGLALDTILEERQKHQALPAKHAYGCRLLVQRYVELLRSRSHSDTNTALKVWQALCAKYAGQRQPNTTLFDRYVAEKRGEAPCE
jgi:hypothetical protein